MPNDTHGHGLRDLTQYTNAPFTSADLAEVGGESVKANENEKSPPSGFRHPRGFEQCIADDQTSRGFSRFGVQRSREVRKRRV